MSGARFSGGCQCGAIRYAAEAEPLRASVCHCRMCQRAVGNVFAPLVEFATSAVAWERGQPAVFASSNIAERGFCAACGTPLFYRAIGGETIEFMIATLDHPERAAPTYQNGVESRAPWLDGLDALPGHVTGGGPNADSVIGVTIISRQAPIDEVG